MRVIQDSRADDKRLSTPLCCAVTASSANLVIESSGLNVTPAIASRTRVWTVAWGATGTCLKVAGCSLEMTASATARNVSSTLWFQDYLFCDSFLSAVLTASGALGFPS